MDLFWKGVKRFGWIALVDVVRSIRLRDNASDPISKRTTSRGRIVCSSAVDCGADFSSRSGMAAAYHRSRPKK